jgi:mannose-6-phosphate isomerase-like protein (cupin superfamily)
MSTVTSVRHAPADHLQTARRYAARPDDWPIAARFNPVRRWYQRLADGPDSEVWLLSWLPGQGTDLHDHGGSSGAFVVVRGALTEHTVAASPGGGPPRQRERLLPAGEGRSFGPRHIHRIVNAGLQPAVSLHVYGPALQEMTRYRVDDGRLLVSAVERAGTDW